MEITPGFSINISLVISLMIKISMVLLLVLGLIMIRQESLMDKVVNLPVGKSLKTIVWLYFLLTLFVTVIVLLA